MVAQDQVRHCQEQEAIWAAEKAQLKAGLTAALDQKCSAEGDLAAAHELAESLRTRVRLHRGLSHRCTTIHDA